MAEYKIRLETFEGPVALLMHLIEKNKIDIYDIPIAQITEQYLNYLATMEELNLDIASEFIVMAATLLRIKSSMLLPKRQMTDDGEDELQEDPRQELVERLLEYRKYKEITCVLENMLKERQCYFCRDPQYLDEEYLLPKGLKVDDLLCALLDTCSDENDYCALISREEISVQDKMYDIVKMLSKFDTVEFKKVLIRSGDRYEMIAAFLAVLELIKTKTIIAFQEQSFSPIYLKMRSETN